MIAYLLDYTHGAGTFLDDMKKAGWLIDDVLDLTANSAIIYFIPKK